MPCEALPHPVGRAPCGPPRGRRDRLLALSLRASAHTGVAIRFLFDNWGIRIPTTVTAVTVSE